MQSHPHFFGGEIVTMSLFHIAFDLNKNNGHVNINFMVTPLRDIFSSPADESSQQIPVPSAIYIATLHTKIPTMVNAVPIHVPPYQVYQVKLFPQ